MHDLVRVRVPLPVRIASLACPLTAEEGVAITKRSLFETGCLRLELAQGEELHEVRMDSELVICWVFGLLLQDQLLLLIYRGLLLDRLRHHCWLCGILLLLHHHLLLGIGLLLLHHHLLLIRVGHLRVGDHLRLLRNLNDHLCLPSLDLLQGRFRV